MLIWSDHAKLGKRENSAVVGILLSPVMHRILQQFHFDEESTKTER